MSEKIVLFDSMEAFENLLPLSYTRPVGAFRIGILKINEKWARYLDAEVSFLPVEYLREKFPVDITGDDEALFIAGNVLPDLSLADELRSLPEGGCLVGGDKECIAFRGTLLDFQNEKWEVKEYGGELRRIKYVFDVFLNNGDEIRKDFNLITAGRKSIQPDKTVTILGDAYDESGNPMLFIEEGAEVSCAILNLKNGPVYIGKDAEVMEGAIIRGPFALCENAKVKMGAKIYEDTTLGPYCKVGGEVNNTVFFGFSNKAHDGYLGNAVVGEWCNLGAGANSSNLKNDYSKIRIWNYAQQRFMRTDLQFCGLIMGDHSKAGINTMFNTATVVGVGVNFHGSGFPRQFIPSFQNGSPEGGFTDVSIDKFMEVAGKVMARRHITLNDIDRHILEYIYASAARFK